jgi:hypothetical protein
MNNRRMSGEESNVLFEKVKRIAAEYGRKTVCSRDVVRYRFHECALVVTYALRPLMRPADAIAEVVHRGRPVFEARDVLAYEGSPEIRCYLPGSWKKILNLLFERGPKANPSRK